VILRLPRPRDDGRTGRRVLFVTFLSACAGGAWGKWGHGEVFTGALGGAANGGLLSFFEGYVLGGWAYRALLRLPFGVYFVLRVAMYVGVVLFVNIFLFTLIFGAGDKPTFANRDIGFAFAMCVALNLLFGVNELLGPGVLFAFVAGRYRRPRREDRVLLYLDLCGSTALAERLGEERFLDLLNEFFADVTMEIIAQGGEIHKYVGDEVIAVWRAGTDAQQPIRACFSCQQRFVARAANYRSAFGATPAFRAAIHAGPVVVGELGAQKKEIALIGDAMNTTARILEAARDAGAALLVSAPLFDRMRAPLVGVEARRLPPIPLRGKAAALELVAVG
jgi:adenylate cyclase